MPRSRTSPKVSIEARPLWSTFLLIDNFSVKVFRRGATKQAQRQFQTHHIKNGFDHAQ